MPRPERPLDPSAGPVQAFAAELRKLRAGAGDPKYLQMARMTGRSRTALSEAAGGDHLPTWETTEAFVKACGADIGTWRLRWERVQEQMSPWGIAPTPANPTNKTAVDARVAEDNGSSASHLGADTAAGAEVLLRMWHEQRTQGRQSENHRAIMTIVVVIGAVGGMTYVAVGHGNRYVTASAAFAVCLLGLFGAVICAKYFERFKMHMDGAQALRRRLDDLYPALRLEEDWSASRRQHENNYKVLSRIRLEHLWVVAHLGIAFVGAIATVVHLLD
ncbi:helix-turn-helix domain-containing protein [Nocardia sp. CA-129566]|uniref:helix-turn-helix domain-containing protein n=1 Tax=Nocardia sp. CA-129566 TaxID=3239976 RepID=UPI003D970EC6